MVQEKNLAVNGTLTLSARGQGTLDDPQLTASLQLPRLDVKQKSIAGLKAEVNVANKQADLTVDSQVAQAAIRARGHVNLTGDFDDRRIHRHCHYSARCLAGNVCQLRARRFQGRNRIARNRERAAER